MANIRIDNFSGDGITVILDGQIQTVGEDERVTFNSLEKGTHSLQIHRTRIPLETVVPTAQQEQTPQEKMETSQQSIHTYLDLSAEIELDSSKAIIAVKSDISAGEGKGLDVIFSSYSVTATGAKIKNESKVFANKKIGKDFVSKHIRKLMFPIGICSAAILAIAVVALVSAIGGNPIDVGGTTFTLPWSAGFLLIATAFAVYTIICTATILSTAKKYRIKK